MVQVYCAGLTCCSRAVQWSEANESERKAQGCGGGAPGMMGGMRECIHTLGAFPEGVIPAPSLPPAHLLHEREHVERPTKAHAVGPGLMLHVGSAGWETHAVQHAVVPVPRPQAVAVGEG